MAAVEDADVSTEPREASRLGRILKWLGIALLILTVILVALVWTGIGTQAGRTWLVDTVVKFVNRSPDMQVQIEGLQSPSLASWQIRSVQIRRDQSLWLDAENIHLDWRPKALLGRRIIVDELTVDQLKIDNSGQEPNVDAPDEASASLPDLDTLNVPEIRLERFDLGLFRLIASSNEESAENVPQVLPDMQIEGEISLLRNSPDFIALEAQFLGEHPTYFRVQLTEETKSQFLIEGSVDEPAGGYIGHHLKLPEEQPIDSSFQIYAGKSDLGYQLEIESVVMPVGARDLSAQGEVLFSGNFDQIEVRSGMLNVDDSQNTLEGSLNNEDIDFSLVLDRFPIDLLSTFDLLQYQDASIDEGQLSGQINLLGTLSDPEFESLAQLHTRYNEQALSVSFSGAGDAESVLVDQLEVLWGSASLLANGTLDIASDNSDFEVQANDFDLGLLRDFGIDIPPDAELILSSATGEIFGSLKDPDAELQLRITGDYLGESFGLFSEIEKSQSLLNIEQIDLEVDGSKTVADGTLNLDTLIGEFSIDTESFQLRMIELAGVVLPSGLNGLLEGNASVSGDLRNPAVQADLSLAGRYQDIPYSMLALGSREGEVINVETLNVATYDNTVLSLEGKINETDMDIRLRANRLPTQLLSAVGFDIKQGEFSADFTGVGPMTLPTIHGDLSYNADFNGYNEEGDLVTTELGWQLDVSTVEENYSLHSTFSRAGTKSGELTLAFPAKPYMDLVNQSESGRADPLPLHLELDGNFALQTLSFFLDPEIHRIQGDMITDLRINGTLETPELDGTVRFKNTHYENPISGTRISDLNCAIDAVTRAFRFDQCNASDGGSGSFQVLGEFELPIGDESGYIDIELEVNQASVLQRPEIESEATGNIQVSGNFQTLLAKGELEVAPLEASLDANISSGIPRINVEKVQSFDEYENQEKQLDSPLPVINLDLLITASRQAYIRGRGLEAELQGQISLEGTTEEPRYEGEFKTTRGAFEIFGKEFVLQDGLVNFANNAIGLNIEGVYDRKGQRISAIISGTVDDLAISLSAVPSMAEDEILAFIIFGKSVQSITPFEAIQLASAVQQLRGGGGFNPISAARDALGVDTLSIESQTLEDDSTGINVGVGKYLNEKVYLEVERTPNPSQPWKGSLEIEVTPNINLESSTGGTTGIEGAEIKWTKDY